MVSNGIFEKRRIAGIPKIKEKMQDGTVQTGIYRIYGRL